ncbi:MAG: hypothetical protein ACRD2L_09065 [Terriglobia bacterium]
MWRVTPVNPDKITRDRQESAMFDRLSPLDSLNQSHQAALLALRNKPLTSLIKIHQAFSLPFNVALRNLGVTLRE